MTYNESLSGMLGIGKEIVNSTSQTFVVSKGYEVFVRSRLINQNVTRPSTPTNSVTLALKGNIHQGNISIPISYTNSGVASADGFNFIGNPYPSSIDWESAAWTKTNLAPSYYGADPGSELTISTTLLSQTFTYIPGVGCVPATVGCTNIIAQGQGFYVQANAANPQLLASENVKTAINGKRFFRKSASDIENMLKINVTSSHHYMDETLIRFDNIATENFDNSSIDVPKFQNDSLSLSTKTKDNRNLVLNTLSISDSSTTIIPIEIKSSSLGKHVLAFSELENMDSSIKLYLNDNLRNTTRLINNQTVANFYNSSDSTSNGIVNRFSIIATKNESGMRKETNKNESPLVLLFPNPVGKEKIINIKMIDFKDESLAVSVFGLAGNVVLKKSFAKKDTHFTLQVPLTDIASGVYLVEIKSKSMRKIQKIVVE